MLGGDDAMQVRYAVRGRRASGLAQTGSRGGD